MDTIRLKIKANYQVILGIVAALIVCVSIFCYYGNKKEIMFCDEVYSYTMINVRGVHIAVRDNKWYTAPEMDKRFCSLDGYNLKAVKEGAGWDISPPIYYLLFKVAAATFPTSSSKWIGFGLNLFFFIPFLGLLYWGIWKITKKPWLAAVITILLGIHPGIQGIALLIRMYMLFLLCVQIFFIQTEGLYNKPVKIRTYFVLGITTFVGFMTHYYFAIYVALFSAFFMLGKALQKNWKQLFAYLGTMVAAVAAATVFFPQWIAQIFSSTKGSSSINALFNWSNVGEELLKAFRQIGEFVFPGNSALYWILLVIICVLFFRLKDEELTDIKRNFGLHLAAQMTYYVAVAHLMPSPEERYYWVIIVLQCIMALFMLAYIMKYYGMLELKQVMAVLLGITVIYAAMFPNRMDKIPYHGAKFKEGRQIMEEYEQTPWIIYGEKDWVLHCTAFDFLIPEHLMFITDASTLVYDEVLQSSKEIVLYVRSEEHLENTVERLEELSGNTYSYRLLAERPFNNAYLITLE